MFELCLLPSVHLVPCTRAEACLACGDLPRVQASLFAAELEEEAWRQCTGGYARTDRASISSYEKRCRTTIHNLREQTYAAAVSEATALHEK
jgi:CRISPR/Cas system-associated endoribonuclease Cas2